MISEKMQLNLHIGTEKTGSSYLQTLLARNREHLQQQHIFYPSGGKWEKEMRAGRISAGNGEPLCNAILNNDWLFVQGLLKDYYEMAKSKNCITVLLSNEILVKAFSEQKTVTKFVNIAMEIGFENIRCLLFLRDPVDQALSLYKHRAKYGEVESLENWLKTDYDVPVYMKNFLNILPVFHDYVSIRRYDKSSKFLTTVLFREWLKVDWPATWEDSSVNESLTLSELAVIKLVRMHSPEIVGSLYSKFLLLPKIEKAKDHTFTKNVSSRISEHISLHDEVWEACNKHLPKGEALEIIKSASVMENESHLHLNLSEHQLEIVLDQITKANSLSFKLSLMIKQLRHILALIKWKIFKQG